MQRKKGVKSTPFFLFGESFIFEIARITFLGGTRDKVFITLVLLSVLCFIAVVPAASALSMRQTREVAVGLSLSMISFVSLVLTVFLSVTLVYKDIEQRFSHSVISMPISRESYILGKFLGLSLIIASGVIILSAFSVVGISMAAGLRESDIPMMWENFVAAVFFEYIMLIVIAAISVLFSSFATNLFLPLFITIGFYIIGNVTQTVMDYIKGPHGQKLPVFSIFLSNIAYYLFPNLSALDLKFHAIYSLPLSPTHLVTLLAYALIYLIIVLGLAVLVFRRRELL